MDRQLRLLLEAFWLAFYLTGRLQSLDEAGALCRDHRLFCITGKAWERFRRRRACRQATVTSPS